MKALNLIEKLEKEHALEKPEYKFLIENKTQEIQEILAKKARNAAIKVYGKEIFIRGLIEISNICKNDCFYCGIRKSNNNCKRYHLDVDEILNCCEAGYNLGFRTFVLQGGEDPYFTDDVLCDIVKKIRENYKNVAISLSLGQRSKKSYQKLFAAGANRYLLRHETANSLHYSKLHPDDMSFDDRIKCLHNLKEIGFQTGCGFMVGSPFQSLENIVEDLKFIEKFKPHMCGVGPFIPHKDTPFKDKPAGSVSLTCYLLSIIRLIKPNILLPSTTALATLDNFGAEKGILSGANVVMPNISPGFAKKNYNLYNGKKYYEDINENLIMLKEKFEKIGYKISNSKGDIKN